MPVNDSWSTTLSSAIFCWVRLLIRYSFRPIARMVTPTRGKTAIAIKVSSHSRRNMTTSSAMMVPTWRTAITSTVEESRARRLTSVTTRVISSAECSEAKKASGMDWMWA